MTPPSPSPGALDPQAVKVLAHPLRSRLLAQLRRSGDATATALATALGTNSGATSYHLRRLAQVGLVVDAGPGRGRERRWRAATPEHSWAAGDLDGDEDAVTALGWIERDYVRHFTTRAEEWLEVAPTWPAGWSDHLGLTDHLVLVTRDQLQALQAELGEVLQRYRRVGQGNPSAKRVAVYGFAYPVDLDNVPAREP